MTEGSKSEPEFWVVYQLGAFQGRMNEDADPNDSDGTPGLSSLKISHIKSASDAEAGTIVYAETIRDVVEKRDPGTVISVPNLKKIVSIHEIGHQFGMDDTPFIFGPMMNVSQIIRANKQEKVDDLKWNGDAFRVMMTTKQPGHQPH